MRELTVDEMEQVSGGCGNFRHALSVGATDFVVGGTAGAIVGGTAAVVTGGALAPAIGVGFIGGAAAGFLSGFGGVVLRDCGWA